jgi:hypothetical protein
MVTGMGRKPWLAKQSAVIIFALCALSLSSVTHGEAAGDGAVSPSSFTTDTLGIVDNSTLEYGVAAQAPPVPTGYWTPSHVFRDIPSISGDYLGGGTRLRPYIGAGFGNGYAADLDRSLSGLSSLMNSGSRSYFGQGLTPSEFQMGIRIPF